MSTADERIRTELLRSLPSIDKLLQTETGRDIESAYGSSSAVGLARAAVDGLRREILSDSKTVAHDEIALLTIAKASMATLSRQENRRGIAHVINATGVIIHTNLGRSPLSDMAKSALVERAGSYCNVELDVETGLRGKRGGRADSILCELTGAEDAIVVNNCAAAAFFVLNAFASGREVIVSRGELVEIGGDFRVPDVLERSGAILREVGTTNRTKLRDYEVTISENTGMILRVHPSNYRIVGFTESPDLRSLAELARNRGVKLFEDAGSGALADLSSFGLDDEPLISRSIADGADLVSFSGDKLLGGVQAGIIVGRTELIETLRRHPMYRALRVDKLVYAALEATLGSYRRGSHFEEIPVLRMIAADADEILPRALCLAEDLRNRTDGRLDIDVVQGQSVIGGGSAPDVTLPTWLVSLSMTDKTADEIEEKLRDYSTPVISRISEDKVVLDLRTVFDSEYIELVNAVASLAE